jgi:GT2 family glycosyltransferase
VVVVDNASEDDSLTKIREYCQGNLRVDSPFFSYQARKKPLYLLEVSEGEVPDLELYQKLDSREKLLLLKNGINYGFADGNNTGLSLAKEYLDSEYLLILNNDTVVDRVFLKELVDCATLHPEAGIIGPKIRDYHHPDLLNAMGGKIKWPVVAGYNRGRGDRDQGQWDQHQDIDYLVGACLLFPTILLEKVGLLDGNLFLLYEDVDFSIRATRMGYKLLLNPRAVIYHKEGISGELSPTHLYYQYRNRLLILKKHQTSAKVFIYGFYISLRTLMIVFYLTIRGKGHIARAILRGYRDGIR